MFLPRPIHPYYFHADLIWWDGPFKRRKKLKFREGSSRSGNLMEVRWLIGGASDCVPAVLSSIVLKSDNSEEVCHFLEINENGEIITENHNIKMRIYQW